MANHIYTDEPLTINPGFAGDPYYDILLSFRGTSGLTFDKTLATGVTGEYTFTPSIAEFGPYVPESNVGVLTIICDAKTGRHQSYDADYYLTVNDNVKPVFENAVCEYTNTFNDNGVIGISGAYIKISLKGLYGAKQTLRVLDESGSQIDYRQIYAVNDDSTTIVSSYVGPITKSMQKYTLRATDSRGRTTEATFYLGTSYTYTKPDITASVVWNSSSKPALSYTATIQSNVAGGTNKLTKVEVMYTDSTGKLYTENYTDANKSGVPLSGTFDDAGSYSFSIKVSDSISFSTKSLTLEGNKPIIDIGADGNTVAIFGQAPNSADTKSVMIGEMGKITTVIGENGLTMNYSNKSYLELGPDVNDMVRYSLGRRATGDIGQMSLVAGDQNVASGRCSTAGGYSCTASNAYAMAVGRDNVASGVASVALGAHTIASQQYQVALGAYNVEDIDDKYQLIVGNGDSEDSRKNALAVGKDGDLEINNKSVNSLFGGLVLHAYSSTDQTTGTDNSAYTALNVLKTTAYGSLQSLVDTGSSISAIKILKAGLYSIQCRFAYHCSTQWKRFEIAIFVNDTRVPRYASTYTSTINNASLMSIEHWIVPLNAGDKINVKIKPIDRVSITVTPYDFTFIALDYEGKYK